MRLFIDIIGWIGGAEVLLAYLLISLNRIDPKTFLYQFLNASGAVFLIANTVYLGAYPSAAVNVIWVVVAIYSMYKFRIQTKEKEPTLPN